MAVDPRGGVVGLAPGVRRGLTAALMLLLLSVPLVALAEETPATLSEVRDGTFAGTYEVAGSTNTGKPVSAVVVVTDLGDLIQFSSEVYGFPVSSTGAATWNGPEVTVPVSVTVPFIASGSGAITLSPVENGWNFSGSGSGQVFKKSGTASVAGFKPVEKTATAEEIATASGVSEQAQSLDDAVDPLKPADDQGQLDTSETLAGLATILFLAFLLVLLELLIGWFLPF